MTMNVPWKLELRSPEERSLYAEVLHEDLRDGLLGLGVDPGERPLRLAVAELAHLLGRKGLTLVLEARDGEGNTLLRYFLSPEEPVLECMAGRGEWE